MPKSFKKLDEIIETGKEFENLRNSLEKQNVVDRFYEIYPELKRFVVPVKVERKILFLRVDNSVWRSELNFKRNLLIEKINSVFKKEIIKGIKFI